MADSPYFKMDAKGLLNGLEFFGDKSQAAILMYAETAALSLQNHARNNAPWTDRTGHARQRLRGDVLTVANGYKIRLAHGVDYGMWLELAHEKRFAIVQPTIQLKSSEVMKGFQGLLNKLR